MLVAVLGCNIVLFVYNFPGLVGVVSFGKHCWQESRLKSLLAVLSTKQGGSFEHRKSQKLANVSPPTVC